MISCLGKLLETSLTFSALVLESTLLITGAGAPSGEDISQHYADISSLGGEERILIGKQESHTSPTLAAACSF